MMYTYDSRAQVNPFQSQMQPNMWNASAPHMPYATVGGMQMDTQQMLSCMQTQINLLTDCLRTEMTRRTAAGPSASCPVRMRESDSHIYCELYLPQLTVGDCEVEVAGNRILCRTRVSMMASQNSFSASQLPRGFECFTLPDGRLELCWVCPASFRAQEVEACFRDNCLCICIPKTEAVSSRQSVKVVASETFARVQ